MMNKIVSDTFVFNYAGGCPVDLRPDNIRGGLNLVQEEVNEIMEGIENLTEGASHQDTIDALVKIADGAADVIVTAVGVLHRAGLNQTQVNDILSVVGEANKSKFATTEEEAQESVAAYESDSRYFDVKYEQRNRRYAIIGSKATENGAVRKILKAQGWEKPERKIEGIIKGSFSGFEFQGE